MPNHKERIAVIRPSASFLRKPDASEPLTQLVLAAQLRKSGFDPEVLDGAVTQITGDKLFSFTTIAVSATTPQYPEALRLIKLFQEVHGANGAVGLLGGPHVSVLGAKVLEDGWIGVCRNEGDDVIADMARRKLSGFVDGGRIENLDLLPFPARDLIEPRIYKRDNESDPSMSILTMRGCPYSCIYCLRDSSGRRVTFRSPENVAREIKEVRDRYAVGRVVFYDDTFTLDKPRTLEMCVKLKELGVSWICNTRVDRVDREVLEAMSNSGCEEVSFGIESANDRVLRHARKGITRKQSLEAVRMANDAGLKTRVFLMFGFDEDGFDTVEGNLSFLKEANPDSVRLSLLVPFPGTEAYLRAKAQGMDLNVPYEEYYYLGQNGAHTFVKQTRYLDESQFASALFNLEKGLADWATSRNNGVFTATSLNI